MEESDRITLRLERDNLARIDEFLASHQQYGSRSQLCRIALQAFLGQDRKANAEVLVKLPKVLMEFIDALVNEGYYLSREHAILRSVEAFFSKEKINEIAAHRREIDKATGKSFPLAGGDEVIHP